jgi:hypothetical protein
MMAALQPAIVWAGPEPFVIYEDWRSAPTIRSDRWGGLIDSAQEVERRIESDHLVMRFRRAGLTVSDVGSINAFHRLSAVNPLAITQMEADVRVGRIAVSGCDANPTPSAVGPVALTLTKFNDGTAGGPGNQTGDHLARIRVRREATSVDPEGVLSVEGFLFRCGDPQCAGGVFLFLMPLGTVTVDERFTLRLIWNADQNEFIYGLRTVDIPVPYVPTLNARPAFVPLADLRMQGTAANCTSGPTETDARIRVRMIRTNGSAVIP